MDTTMSHSMRRLVSAILVSGTACIATATAQDNSIAPEATATVRGRVTAASNGMPIKSAEVRLRRVDGRDSRLITTDDNGFYEVGDLAAGTWTLKATKPGFVTQQYGQEHPLNEVRPLTLANDQKVVANISLTRGGAISGRVLDQWGEPIAASSVQVMRTRLERGERRLAQTGTTDETDDTGAFRVYGLLPGDYYVAATLRDPSSCGASGCNMTQVRANDTAATYYPGTTRIREAQRVRVDAGADSPAITIVAMPPARGSTVSGVVLDASGNPANSAMLHLYDTDVLAAVATKGTFVQADARGRFSIDDVAPGSYVLDATARMSVAVVGFERSIVPIDVPAGGLSGLTLTTAPASTISLTVVAAPGSTLPKLLTVGLAARGGAGLTTSSMKVTLGGGAGRLQMPGVFGRTVISVTDLPDGWFLDALEISGRDVADTEVDFSTVGATVEARAVITDRPAEVSGVVTVRGQPRPATVVVFVEDNAKWTYPSRFVRTARAGDDGRFTIGALPPAERYRAVAVSYLDEEEIQDPDTLEAMKSAGVGFRLLRGEKKTLEVQAIVR
jgi:hypothetical protein